jgi:hypothetical protein
MIVFPDLDPHLLKLLDFLTLLELLQILIPLFPPFLVLLLRRLKQLLISVFFHSVHFELFFMGRVFGQGLVGRGHHTGN